MRIRGIAPAAGHRRSAYERVENMSKSASKMEAKVEVVFILDRSGSMGGLEDDTIGGFNSMLEKQQKEGGDIVWTTVLFDSEYEVIHDRVPIDKMRPLTGKEYYIRGTTALLDAVGKTIHNIKEVQKKEGGEAPDSTIFVITTDGYENSSVEYTYDLVKEMVQRQQNVFDWEFIFLGANIDAVEEGGRIGIRASRAARYHNDREGIEKNYETVNDVVRAKCCKEYIEDDCLDPIRKDYEGRKKLKDYLE